MSDAATIRSRPPAPSLAGKAAAARGVRQGALGTASADYHLRQALSAMNRHVVPGPEVLVGQSGSEFDAEGRLTGPASRDFVAADLGPAGGPRAPAALSAALDKHYRISI